MKEKRTIRWGILGTAKIARKELIPAIHQSRNGILQAVASRDERKGKEFAAQNRIPQVFGSYEALLNSPEIDAVYIPLPNQMHKEWSIRALDAGKHVLCEKPLALSKADCEEMDRAAQRNQLNLMEAFMYRFHPRVEELLNMVRDGRLGKIRLIRAVFGFNLEDKSNIRLNPDLGGGSLWDVGCYCVNIMRSITGAEPDALQAFADWSSSGVDEHMAGTLYFPGGVVGQFASSFSVNLGQSCQIFGTEGSLEIPQIFRPPLSVQFIYETHERKTTRHVIRRTNDYCRMVEHFADSVLNGVPLRYGIQEAAANVHALESLGYSARQQGQVQYLQ